MARISDEQVAGIKWDWLNRQLQSRRADYCDKLECEILLITWNVNGATTMTDLPSLFSGLDGNPKVMIMGMQELVSADQTGLAWGGEGNILELENKWTNALIQAANSAFKQEYLVLETVRLAGILLIVMYSGDQVGQENIKQFGKGQASCGLMGLLGNKGGVALRLRLYDSWLCIVNCHLAANVEYTLRRNQDYQEIRSRLLLPHPPSPALSSYRLASDKALELLRSSWNQGVCVDDCDFLFWIGDLNYRLNMERVEAINLAKEGNFGALLCRDQLREEIGGGRAFSDFCEAEISFPPSYKYDPNTDHFDTSEKARCPAYCDRILWRIPKDKKFKAIEYSSVSILSSDHRPVRALCTVELETIDTTKFEQVFVDVLHSLDLWENAQIPVTELAFPEISGVLDFGTVKFRRLVTKTVELRNNGVAAAQFCFVPTADSAMPSWIRACPVNGILLPGNVVNISLHVLIGPKEAFLLNSDKITLSGTILILHIVGGRDHFIAIEGKYKKTQFAQQLQIDYSTSDGAFYARVPEPLRRLAEHIVQYEGVRAEYMLLQSGDRATVDELIDCIDDDKAFPPECKFNSGMLAVGECLVRWLESLPDPVVPFSFTEKFILGHQRPDSQSLRHLPEPNWIVFDYVCSLFRVMPEINRTVDRVALCYVLGYALTRMALKRNDRTADQHLISFMKHFV